MIDKYTTYWYINDKGIQSTQSKPSKDHVIQTISSMGVAGLRSIKYEYHDKVYNKILSISESENPSIIYDIIHNEVDKK